jgi:type III secretion protein U
MSEKTFKPSNKRLREADEEGNVAKTDSIPHLLAFAGVFELMVATSDHWLSNGATVLGSYISRLGETSAAMKVDVKDVLLPLATLGVTLVLVSLLVACVLALIGNVVQTGVVVSTKGVARLDRLDPIAHAKNMVSAEQMQNLLMNIVKACVIFGIVTFVCLLSVNSLLHVSGTSLMLAAKTTLDVTAKCERMALLLLIVFVVLDWVIKKRAHTEQLKMTREDVDREQKDAFGDKHARAGRNEFRKDMLAGQLTENTRKANAVVTNPTHFAVALLYDPEQYPLPVVCARGTDRDARIICDAARLNDIPVLRSVQLARALYSTGRNGRPVPRVTMKAVAAVYRVVAEIKAGKHQLDDYVELFDEVDLHRNP